MGVCICVSLMFVCVCVGVCVCMQFVLGLCVYESVRVCVVEM